MAKQTKRELIEMTIADLVIALLDEDRGDDEELPRGAIEEALEAGELDVEHMVAAFRRKLIEELGL